MQDWPLRNTDWIGFPSFLQCIITIFPIAVMCHRDVSNEWAIFFFHIFARETELQSHTLIIAFYTGNNKTSVNRKRKFPWKCICRHSAGWCLLFDFSVEEFIRDNFLPLLYILVATVPDVGCLANSPGWRAVSPVFLSSYVKSHCVICFVTEGQREAKQTNVEVKTNHMNPLNI